MNAIPKISFLKQDSDELEFEIFTLNSLFARKDSINLRLDKPHRVDFSPRHTAPAAARHCPARKPASTPMRYRLSPGFGCNAG